MARDGLDRNETFRECGNLQIDVFLDTLPHLHCETERPPRPHDLDTFEVQIIWTSGAGSLHPRVFFVSAEREWAEGVDRPGSAGGCLGAGLHSFRRR